ncbi:hydroxymethylbilane synthase [Corynebacterium lubricantis]|uniref:hydroxymethylbilane synthase n=1 Tax=Corynebacterium lubricantis TaxID=541095 RepID=UPI000372C228|nr:hydroxymethylbilane synthase [Corynebacterium lubricantis]
MLKIGTRGSKLATTQAGHQRDAMNAAGFETELHIVTTAGDVNMAPVERIGVGVFTAALREALFNGECDIAVHSFKDLPTAHEPRTHLITPVREDRREALIARDGLTLDTLPEGARVGTSAPRRISQLKAHRPDLDICPLRGNIETRMGKVTDGELDAVVLAYAGLSRVGLGDRATQIFDPTVIMPAPAQGALAVEARTDDEQARSAIDSLADDSVYTAVSAERTLLAALEAGCTAPVASYAELDGETITLHAGVFSLDGTTQLVETAQGTDPIQLGHNVADLLIARGAARIIG